MFPNGWRFLERSLWPILTFFLVISIGLNAFLLLVGRAIEWRRSAATPVETGESIGLERGPLAFGTISKGFTVQPVPSAPAVRGYEVVPNTFSVLPSTYLLYRDQGVTVPTKVVSDILSSLGVPATAIPSQIFTRSLTLRSLDRQLEILVDIENRVLMLTRMLPPPSTPPPSKPADDAEAIALARAYIDSVGIFAEGEPSVVDQPGTANAPGRTFVVWHATFAGHPLYDESLQPIAHITVQVGRKSHRVVAALINLLTPEELTRSEYPAASTGLLLSGFHNGGLRPLPSRAAPSAPLATISAAELVYVLSPATADFPLYVVPALRARVSAPPSCKTCAAYDGWTYVPAIDPKSFSWLRAVSSVASSR